MAQILVLESNAVPDYLCLHTFKGLQQRVYDKFNKVKWQNTVINAC